MVVLLTGANGFIGRRLHDALVQAGHEVVCAVHRPQADGPWKRQIVVDFASDVSPAAWVPHLVGVDVVVNAVGILRESGSQTYEAIHVRAPIALFSACEEAGVRRVVQISALGADEQAASRFHRTKKTADDDLAARNLDWVILQPSLVYGPEGTSARLFTLLASLPWIPVPGGGDQLVQPVHVDDLVAAVVAAVDASETQRRRIPVVGSEPLRLRDFLARLRGAMGLGPARFVDIPMPLVRLAAGIGTLARRGLLDRETLGMLVRGNVADASAMTRLLGRQPRPVEQFIARQDAPAVCTMAKLQWLLPPLRWSIAIVWIMTGIVSLGVYPVEDSLALLARVGATGTLAYLLLYGAAVLDLVFGLGIFLMRRRRPLWIAQAAVILLYTVIVTIWLPEYWLHPYGPILKNLPMLAAIGLLYHLEPR